MKPVLGEQGSGAQAATERAAAPEGTCSLANTC